MRAVIRCAEVVAGAVLLVVAAAGVASAAPVPALTWSPSGTVSFGALPPGTTSAPPKVFTLTNTGGSASSELTITVTPSSGFAIKSDGCTGKSLGPGKSCTVSVTYTAPATPGQASQATLKTASDKPAATATVTLTGSAAKASPGITTTQQPASAKAGTAVADEATVTGGFSPGGTVTFNLYGNSGCSGTALFTDTENLSGGTATSASYTNTATGTDYWTATYNGDSHNNTVSSDCSDEPVTITPATPAISTTANPASATAGATVADQATVTGGDNPGGTVTFNLYGNSGCSGTALFTDTENLSGGTATSASYTTTAADTGTVYWVATYNGDSNNNQVSSRCADEPVTISPACQVTDTNSGQTYTGLQSAVNAATAGDTLDIAGTCTAAPGGTKISKNLTLTGTTPIATLTVTQFGGEGASHVLEIDSGTVTMNTLTITGGAGDDAGGGINNRGTLTLNNATVTGNSNGLGGGIYNEGTMTLNNTAVTSNTDEGGGGGGIFNFNNGTMTLNSSTVGGNKTAFDGGGIDNVGATLTLNNTTVTGNTASNPDPALGEGGGIFNLGGTVTLNGSTISHNTAEIDGGGIYFNADEGGTVTLDSSTSVINNTPDNCAPANSVPGCTG